MEGPHCKEEILFMPKASLNNEVDDTRENIKRNSNILDCGPVIWKISSFLSPHDLLSLIAAFGKNTYLVKRWARVLWNDFSSQLKWKFQTSNEDRFVHLIKARIISNNFCLNCGVHTTGSIPDSWLKRKCILWKICLKCFGQKYAVVTAYTASSHYGVQAIDREHLECKKTQTSQKKYLLEDIIAISQLKRNSPQSKKRKSGEAHTSEKKHKQTTIELL